MGIIIMGKTGVGKSTVGKILASNIGFSLYEIGHEVKQVYLEKIQTDKLINEKDYVTTNNRLSFTDSIVEKYGNDYYVKRILAKQDRENIIIIGARSMPEIQAIKNKIKFPFFVLLTCSEDEILKRFVKRETKFMSRDEAVKVFEERKKREGNWGVEDISGQANITLSTEHEQPSFIADTIIRRYIEFINTKKIKSHKKELEEKGH